MWRIRVKAILRGDPPAAQAFLDEVDRVAGITGLAFSRLRLTKTSSQGPLASWELEAEFTLKGDLELPPLNAILRAAKAFEVTITSLEAFQEAAEEPLAVEPEGLAEEPPLTDDEIAELEGEDEV